MQGISKGDLVAFRASVHSFYIDWSKNVVYPQLYTDCLMWDRDGRVLSSKLYITTKSNLLDEANRQKNRNMCDDWSWDDEAPDPATP
jgi:hypothetical protein